MPVLEIDAGEHDDEPEELWALADQLNVACGGHAGDAASMARVATFCARAGKRIAAHPSYPDREGFGRRPMAIDGGALRVAMREQCRALRRIVEEHGGVVSAVKPHGQLYHDAAANPAVARELLDGVSDALGDVTVIGPPRGALREVAIARGLPYAREGFADRRMRADGSLVPRSEPDALIAEPARAAAQARSLEVDMICVHADTPGAVAIARAVRAALGDAARVSSEGSARTAAPRWGRTRSAADDGTSDRVGEVAPGGAVTSGVAAWVPLGDRAIRFPRPAAPVRGIVRAVRAWPGVVDVVVSWRHVAAYFAQPPPVGDGRSAVDTWIAALASVTDDPAPVRDVELRCVYDGEDLAAIAEATRLSVGEVCRQHAAATYVVEATGFAPGFAYMTGLPRALVLPRRATPRPRVPAGTIAIAREFTAVYPFDSPGGWHLVGRVVDAPMFGPDGARLRLGDRVRFVP